MRWWFLFHFIVLIATHVESSQLSCGAKTAIIGNTSDYRQIEQIVKERLDFKVHPCQDFYEFACGRFNLLEKKEGVHTRELMKSIREAVEGLLLTEEDVPSKALKVTQHYFKSCLRSHEEWMERSEKFQHLNRKIRHFGSYPLIDGNLKNNVESNSELPLTKLLIFFNKNGTANTQIPLVPKISFLRRRGILEFPIVKEVKAVKIEPIYKLAVALCIETNSTCYVQKLLKDTFNIISLTEKLQDSVSREEKLTTTLGQLNASYSVVDWFEYLREVSPSKIHHLFQDNLTITAPSMDKIKRVDAILRRASKNVIANVIITDYVGRFVFSKGNSDMRFRSLALRATYSKFSSEKECFGDTFKRFGHALLTVYARVSFGVEVHKELKSIFDHLKATFKELVTEKRYWESNLKEALLLKMEKLEGNLGFTDIASQGLETLDNLYVKYYDLDLGGLKFVEMQDIYDRISVAYDFATLDNITATKEQLRRTHDVYSFAINAHYNFYTNFITVLPGYLHPPHFSPSFPRFYNYGSIGFVIGHELMHAFDPGSIFHNEYGDPTSWLPEDFLVEHQSRTKLMQKIYQDPFEKYGYHKQKLNVTARENFADTQGMKLAYNAYQNVKEEKGEEPRLKDAPYFTDEQLFFISFAQRFCKLKKHEGPPGLAQHKRHSPRELRVNLVLKNFAEFAEAFHCNPSSPMNSAVRRYHVFL